MFHKQNLLAAVIAITSCSPAVNHIADQTMVLDVCEGMSVSILPEDNFIYTGKNKTLKLLIDNPRSDTVFTIAAIRDTTLNRSEKDTALTITRPLDANNINLEIGTLTPGFYQINIGRAQFNIGIDPEKISSPQDRKIDFNEFWNKALTELKNIPLNAKAELVPEHSSDKRQCFKIEINSLDGATMGGIVTIPVKPGKYPVSIEYMGYGADPYYRDPDSDPERIDFLVSVRGQGIFKQAGYDGWAYEGLKSPYNYYYRGAYCDVVRAIDFICSLDKADTSKIFAWGDSQGGAFTWVSAALDHRVRAIAPSVPFLGDFPDYWKIVWWPVCNMFDTGSSQGLSREEVLGTLSYFDIKNLADRVQCPVYMAFGLQDPTCPPHTNFAGYNQCRAPKKYWCVPLCKHAMWAEPSWQAERRKFFEEFI